MLETLFYKTSPGNVCMKMVKAIYKIKFKKHRKQFNIKLIKDLPHFKYIHINPHKNLNFNSQKMSDSDS